MHTKKTGYPAHVNAHTCETKGEEIGRRYCQLLIANKYRAIPLGLHGLQRGASVFKSSRIYTSVCPYHTQRRTWATLI